MFQGYVEKFLDWELCPGAQQDGLHNSPATISSAVKNPLLWSQVEKIFLGGWGGFFDDWFEKIREAVWI